MSDLLSEGLSLRLDHHAIDLLDLITEIEEIPPTEPDVWLLAGSHALLQRALTTLGQVLYELETYGRLNTPPIPLTSKAAA